MRRISRRFLVATCASGFLAAASGCADEACAPRSTPLSVRYSRVPLAEQRCAASVAGQLAALVWEGEGQQPAEAQPSRGRGERSVVARLEVAAAVFPDDPRIWSDLAAARLERASANGEEEQLVLAWSAVERALTLDPALGAARFNRAEVLRRFALNEQARRDWQTFLNSEPDPEWRREAERNLATLPPRPATAEELWGEFERVRTAGVNTEIAAVIDRCRRCFRERGLEQLLPNWAERELAGRVAEAEEDLGRARAIGVGLLRLDGDRALAEAVQRIDALSRGSAERRAMAEAIEAFGRGVRESSGSLLTSAERDLQTFGSPLAGWARYWRARGAAFDEAEGLLRDLDTKGPPSALRGRVRHFLALTVGGTDYERSAALGEKAARDLRTFGEKSYEAKAWMHVATCRAELGQHREAWQRLVQALVLGAREGETRERVTTWQLASRLALASGERRLALRFQDESVRLARATEEPDLEIEALRERAEILVAAGRQRDAARDLAEANELLGRLGEAARLASAGPLGLVEAELAAERSPRQALALLDRALPSLSEDPFRRVEALELRARVERTLGEFEGARANLLSAVAEIERQRELVSSREDRIGFFDRRRAVYDALTRLEFDDLRAPERALVVAESARARALKDWLDLEPASRERSQRLASEKTLAPRHHAKTLPRDGAVVVFAVLPERTFLWVLRANGEIQSAASDIGSERWRREIDRFRAALARGDRGESRKLAAKLGEALLGPIAAQLHGGEALVLLPDGPLHALPFALLRTSAGGPLLVERHAISVAPSLAALAPSANRRRARVPPSSRRVFVTVEPTFDRAHFPDLAPLAAGDVEAKIADSFPGSEVLRGASATRSTFLAQAPSFEILHFGGHALVDRERPLASLLLFAADAADPARGALPAREILDLRLPRAELVVLASCQSGGGRISRTEGVESLARPFLVAGVPTVVAALWKVDDQPTAEFMVRFYGQLARTSDVAKALRAAQREALAAGGDPWTWGAFQVIGASGPR